MPEAGAGRSRRRAERLVVVRERECGEVRKSRVEGSAARAVPGEQTIDAREEPGLPGARARHERAGQRVGRARDRDGHGPRQR